MNGPGKYDDITTHVRKETKADAVLVIIVDGNRGNGFECQCNSPYLLRRLPDMLRFMANQIEQEVEDDIRETEEGKS